MSLRLRLTLFAAASSLLLMATGLFGLYEMHALKTDLATGVATLKKENEALIAVETAHARFKIQVQEWKDILLRGNDREAFDKYSKEFAKEEKLVQENLTKASALMHELRIETTDVQTLLKSHAELGTKYREALKSFDPNNPEAGHIVDKLVKGIDRPTSQGMEKVVRQIEDDSNRKASEEVDNGETRFVAARNPSLVMLAIGIVMIIALAFSIIRKLTKGLTTAVATANRLAQGDLTTNIEVTSKDEVGQLLAAMRDMVGKLRELITQIRESTDSVGTASQQIASGNAELSTRTEEQASSLEETASSMEQLTATVKQNADNAKQANQLAIRASDVAAKGGTVVGEVVGTMNAISASSKKIADIISVIDGIAFQTNILALNAAVEAARAGEQGRGFAVVASEVRNLAQRSAAAAKEIKGLIGDSVDRVESGSKLVAQAGQTMDDVVASVRRVTDIMGEIAAASVEQSSGIEQVNQAITQMDQMTQQNAALVEEAAAAAESMEEQARALATAVAVFRLQEAQALAAAMVEKAARPAAESKTTVPAAPGPALKGPKANVPVNATAKRATDDAWSEF